MTRAPTRAIGLPGDPGHVQLRLGPDRRVRPRQHDSEDAGDDHRHPRDHRGRHGGGRGREQYGLAARGSGRRRGADRGLQPGWVGGAVAAHDTLQYNSFFEAPPAPHVVPPAQLAATYQGILSERPASPVSEPVIPPGTHGGPAGGPGGTGGTKGGTQGGRQGGRPRAGDKVASKAVSRAANKVARRVDSRAASKEANGRYAGDRHDRHQPQWHRYGRARALERIQVERRRGQALGPLPA